MPAQGDGRPALGPHLARRARWATTVAVPVAVPVAMVLVGGWQRRWLCDDAFINFRVIDQTLAGNGPVFNQGERVEVTTSTLWAVVVGFIHVATRVRLEWVAVAGGLLTTALAVAVGASGARHLHTPVEATPPDDGAERVERAAHWWLPAGAVAFAAIPVVWDYTTGGLENGLSWLWWSATFALAVRSTVGVEGASRARVMAAAGVVAGLGPLVRPDLALPAGVFLVLLVVRVARAASGRRETAIATGRLVLLAGALPVLYQVFRMGYYGQLLPNTVYAKEGGRAWWDQGGRYLGDLVSSYWLWVPAVAAGVVVAAAVPRGRRRPPGWVALVVTAEVAAAGHALLVVRAGGDYMQGRLLLPALLGALLPAFAVPVPSLGPDWIATRPGRARLAALGVGALVLLAWAGTAVVSLRPPPGSLTDGIFDNRQFTLDGTGEAHPMLVEDHVAYLEDDGTDLRQWGRGEPPGWTVGGRTLAPLAPGRRTAMTTGAIGAFAYRLPLGVTVIDQLGLADPVVAHVRLPHRGVPGHEKFLRDTWWAARILAPGEYLPVELNGDLILVVTRPDPPSKDPAVVRDEQDAAATALACDGLADLQEMATEPLTLGRFWSNVVRAPGRHAFRFDADPAIVARELCD